MKNVHVGSHENSREDLDSSQGFRVCIRCDYKEKIDMNWMDTFGMDMKKMRMVMYSASIVMKNL